jgi:hypothetical protein
MSHPGDTAYIFVGSDRSQLLAVKVLEYSIRRHTDLRIELRSMHDLVLPDPADPRQGKRTGFSFTRFAIPKLMGYRGRAVYLDADMLVFRDFRELWELHFDGRKILIQEELPTEAQKRAGGGKRLKQCSVMLLDCAALDWDPEEIIAGLDGRHTYEELLFHMCVLPEEEIGYTIPFAWNSLETYEPRTTGLIHYTDMNTQPWVNPANPHGWLWLEEVRRMIAAGALSMAEIEQEIALGYFRPSLAVELREFDGGRARPITAEEARRYQKSDDDAGYRRHRAVYEAAHKRQQAVAEYEARLARQAGAAAAIAHAATDTLRNGAGGLRQLVGALRRTFR